MCNSTIIVLNPIPIIIAEHFRRSHPQCHHSHGQHTGTAEGEGLVGPWPHHFFAPPPPLFALERKIIKVKKRLETSFFPSIFRYILCIFFNFKRQAFCGAPVRAPVRAPVLFAVIVLWGQLAP